MKLILRSLQVVGVLILIGGITLVSLMVAAQEGLVSRLRVFALVLDALSPLVLVVVLVWLIRRGWPGWKAWGLASALWLCWVYAMWRVVPYLLTGVVPLFLAQETLAPFYGSVSNIPYSVTSVAFWALPWIEVVLLPCVVFWLLRWKREARGVQS